VDGNNQTVTNAYRNVKTLTYNGTSYSISYEIGDTSTNTKDVLERKGPGSTMDVHYSPANVDLEEPNPSGSGFSNWCRSCHGNFHSTDGTESNNTEGYLKHPTAKANVGALSHGHSSIAKVNSKSNRTKWMLASGQWASQTLTAQDGVTPTCISCHKAHGNKNAFGLIWGGVATSEEGDGSGVTYLCGQCHLQGP
jgi:hypothetical protein